MVNFTGGLRGLGVALTTLGTQGMAAQQRAVDDQRLLDREKAFATFQQGIRNQDADTAVDRGVDEIKFQTPHRAAAREAELAAAEPFAVASEQRTEARQARNREADNAEWTRRQDVQFRNQLREIQVRADTETAQHLREYQMGIGSGQQPRYLEDGSTNTYVAQYPDGHSEDTGVTLRPRASESGGDGEGGDSGGTPGDTLVRAGVAAARRGGTLRARTNSNPGQPPIAGARQAPDGNWYIQRGGRTFRVDT